ncbi:MAG: hypothetical protein N2167_11190 [Flavobacteriales bacterium]|nr:hypothetical protein [Flavobacteriales bacterium]
MKNSTGHRVFWSFFKKTGVLFLVFFIMLIQIPDAFWQEFHAHAHHDCGLPNVVHQYTPDCTLELRFLQPWYQSIIPSLQWILNPLFIAIESKLCNSFNSSLVIIHRNKAPPGRMA